MSLKLVSQSLSKGLVLRQRLDLFDSSGRLPFLARNPIDSTNCLATCQESWPLVIDCATRKLDAEVPETVLDLKALSKWKKLCHLVLV